MPSLVHRCCRAALALAALTASHWAVALECVGLLRNAGRTYAALREAPREPAVWVALGGRFGAYRVVRIVPDRDIVVLVAPDGSEQEVPLAAAVTHDGGVPAAEPAGSSRPVQLAARAAYQLIYDTGMTEVTGAMVLGTLGPVRAAEVGEVSRWRMRLVAGGNLAIVDASGGVIDAKELGPVHILVPPGLPLAEIAARLHASAATLSELNPGFVNPASETQRRTVRVR